MIQQTFICPFILFFVRALMHVVLSPWDWFQAISTLTPRTLWIICHSRSHLIVPLLPKSSLRCCKTYFSLFCFLEKSFFDIGLLESMKCQSEPFASKSCEGLIVNLLCATPGKRTKVLHSQVLFRSLVFFLIFQHFIIRSGEKNRKLWLIWLLFKLGPIFFHDWTEKKYFLTKLNRSLKL